jgi:hypothetical protein
LPLDTLALVGALLEWGHQLEALQYLGWFFRENIDSKTGGIEYKNFGCDSDADYGRVIDLYVTAVRYSGNTSWASGLLPAVHAMATMLLDKREGAVRRFPAGSPLHGIVRNTILSDSDPAEILELTSHALFHDNIRQRLSLRVAHHRLFCG